MGMTRRFPRITWEPRWFQSGRSGDRWKPRGDVLDPELWEPLARHPVHRTHENGTGIGQRPLTHFRQFGFGTTRIPDSYGTGGGLYHYAGTSTSGSAAEGGEAVGAGPSGVTRARAGRRGGEGVVGAAAQVGAQAVVLAVERQVHGADLREIAHEIFQVAIPPHKQGHRGRLPLPEAQGGPDGEGKTAMVNGE